MVNHAEHIKASSQTPITCLTPEQQMEHFVNITKEIRSLRRKCQALSNRLMHISECSQIEIIPDNNEAAFTLIEKAFNSFKGKSNEMMNVVLQAMMMKLVSDKKNVQVTDNFQDSLTLDEKFECEELASIVMEQMKANAMKLNGKDKGIQFSPHILSMALSLYTCSPVGYREFKNASLMVFPSEQTMDRMISKMRTNDGICPKTYQWLYDKTISDMHDGKEKAGRIMCDKLQIKSTLCWNTKTHALVGFTTDSTKLDFLDELREIEKIIKENGHAVQQSNDDDDDKIAKKLINGVSVQLKENITMASSGLTMAH